MHSADGSIGFPYVRVGHCQDWFSKTKTDINTSSFFFIYSYYFNVKYLTLIDIEIIEKYIESILLI